MARSVEPCSIFGFGKVPPQGRREQFGIVGVSFGAAIFFRGMSATQILAFPEKLFTKTRFRLTARRWWHWLGDRFCARASRNFNPFCLRARGSKEVFNELVKRRLICGQMVIEIENCKLLAWCVLRHFLNEKKYRTVNGCASFLARLHVRKFKKPAIKTETQIKRMLSRKIQGFLAIVK